MLRIIFFLILLTSVLTSSAQGNWNIGYIPIDTLSKKHISLTVRIDFKTNNISEGTSYSRSIRSYVGTRDTGLINIDSVLITVAERRKIFIDHGSYNDQFLECLNCKEFTLRVYDAEILQVDEYSILFRIETEESRKNWDKITNSSKTVRIEKDKLDGVLYQL